MAQTLQELVAEAKQEVAPVSVEDAAARVAQQNGNPLIIDVREGGEYHAAHLPGAIHVPRGLLELKIDPMSPAFDPQFEDRDRPILAYCTGGINARSALSAQTLKHMGFSDVAWLDGGLTAWSGAGKPVESDK